DKRKSNRVDAVCEGTDCSDVGGRIWSTSNRNTAMFTETEDGGVHWSNSTKVVPPNGEVHSRPAIIKDSNGVLYIAWYATNQTVERNAQIGWVSSTDHGKTWSQPQLIPETYGIDQRD